MHLSQVYVTLSFSYCFRLLSCSARLSLSSVSDSCASNSASRISASKYFQIRSVSFGTSSTTFWLLIARPTELSFAFRVDNRSRRDEGCLVPCTDSLWVDG